MTVEEQYLQWIQSMIDPSHSFRRLIDYLYSVAYEWSVLIDENLEWSGVDLRKQFMKECDIHDVSSVASLLVRPCSILELLCGVAQDIELDLRDSVSGVCCISIRFLDILMYLKLDMQFDENFEPELVKKKLKVFLCKKSREKGYYAQFQEFFYERYFRPLK